MDNIKILIVEDELLIAKGLARQLQKTGYTVGKIVSSGKATLEYIDTELPDLILMDIAIKGKMNGIETAAKIREKNEIPIIFLTAYADDKTIDAAVVAGGYGYLLKPYKTAELHALIKMALKKYQEQLAIKNSLQEVILKSSKTSLNSEALALEQELYSAVEKSQLELVYQPKMELKTGKILGMEALVRWHHPVLGTISPDTFMPIAEQSNLIEIVGEWVLEAACRQTKLWHDQGFTWLNVAVNLSGSQLKQSNLIPRISQILLKTGLDSHFLELEVTEQILVENIQSNIQKLQLINQIGIQIAIDDFGTGYSSLGYLQQFPFDVLKIDCCFIKNIDQNSTNAIITKTVIDMAHQLNLKVVAEGVETEAELAFLLKHKCDKVQGYLLSRPLTTQEFEELLVSGKHFSPPNAMPCL